MAAAAEATAHSPRSSGRAAARGLSSPWAHVVRGEPSPSTIAPPEPSDRSSPPNPVAEEGAAGSSEGPEHGGNGNAAGGGDRGRKLAWKRPSNGLPETGPAVMGAVSWPALSECTRASPKSSADSGKAISDGSASTLPGPVIISPPLTSSTNSPVANPTGHAPSPRQRLMKRGGGPAANGRPAFPSPPPAPAGMPHAAPDRHAGLEPSPRNSTTNFNWDHGTRSSGFSAQTHGSGDHLRSYGGNRRGSNGGNFGSRRDMERGGYDWNQNRGFSNRDARMQPPPPPRGMPRPFIRPQPPSSAPFMGPPLPVQPYMNPMFPDMSSPVFYTLAPPEPPRGPVMYLAPPDHRVFLVRQIDYYFSSENLCKDIYLRQNMDDQGWVPISLIAGFNRVKQLTNNIQYILDAVRASVVVEVQGDKIRRRNDWMNWVLPPSPNQHGTGQQSPTISNYDSLVACIQSVGLEDGTTNRSTTTGPTRHEVVLNRSGSGNFYSLVSDSNGEWSGSAAGQRESGRSIAARSLARSDTL